MDLLRLRMMVQIRGLSVTKNLLKGHSKWDNIKNIKKANDQSKSKLLSMLQLRVKRAVKTGGVDIKMNRELAELQLEYRKMSLSEETFQKTVKTVQGLLKKKTTQMNFFGPSGSMFVVEAEMSAKKLKDFVDDYLSKERASFQFTSKDFSSIFAEKGVVVISPTVDGKVVPFDEVEELGIILDCDDVNRVMNREEECYELICVSTKLSSVKKELLERGYTVKNAEIERRALSTVEVNEEDHIKIQNFYQFLKRNESITQVYDNIRPDATGADGKCLEIIA